VSTSQPSHIEDAVASLDIELTADETAAQEAPYTPVVRDFPLTIASVTERPVWSVHASPRAAQIDTISGSMFGNCVL
jgi:hypothetical protein